MLHEKSENLTHTNISHGQMGGHTQEHWLTDEKEREGKLLEEKQQGKRANPALLSENLGCSHVLGVVPA